MTQLFAWLMGLEVSDKVIDVDKRSHLDVVLGGINGALNKVAENVSPPDTSVAQEIAKLSDNVGKWLATINETQSAGFAAVVAEIAKLNKLPPPQHNPLEVKFMFVVKDDNADVNFSVVTGDVTDTEGNVIPDAQIDLAVASTDESVVAVSFDAASKSGSVHFGNPGTATVTATASSGGTLLGSGAADFTVTVGDPAAISSISLSFDGLTES